MRFALILIPCVLAAVEEPVPFATFTGDPCTTLTVRLVGSNVPSTLRWKIADGPWTDTATSIRPVPDTALQVAEFTATGAAPGTRITVMSGTVAIGAWNTLRDRLDQPLRLAMGGDMMHEEPLLAATCKAVAVYDPEAAVIGGDWAYDNAEAKNVGRWLTLLDTWRRTMVRKDGTGVPFVAAIGNHEMSHDGHKPGTYAALFPEPSYRVLDIGTHTSLFLLDTGHQEPIDGPQVPWLAAALEQRQDRRWRIPAYHVPAYASVRKPDDWNAPLIRLHWVPLFERFGVAVAFEHHDHALKRTHPLIGGVPTPGGVLYLGDGAWGVKLRDPVSPEQRPYLAMSMAKHHAWILDLGQDSATAAAVGPEGVLDQVAIPRR